MDIIEYNNKVNFFKLDCGFEFNKDLDYWDYTAIDYRYLICLTEYYTEGDKFLDLGCGPGNVLAFAKSFGYDVTGVEIDDKFKPYLINYDYIIDNILKLETEFYNKFDFIYTYKPLKLGLLKYLDNVANNMKRGYFIYTFFKV